MGIADPSEAPATRRFCYALDLIDDAALIAEYEARHGCTWPPPDLEAIHRDIELPELRALAAANGVDGVVLVQSQDDAADTDWLLSLADDPLVLGIVGWSDLRGALPWYPMLKGLRPMVQDLDADWYDDPAIDAALATMAEHVVCWGPVGAGAQRRSGHSMEASDPRKQCFGDRHKAGRILEGTGGQHRAIDRRHEGVGLIFWRPDQLYASLADAERENIGKPGRQLGEVRLDRLGDVLR